MFQNIPLAQADPILGLNETFKADGRVKKINLGVGAYENNQGITPIPECVKMAESLLLQKENSKSYLPIDGLSSYNQAVQQLIFGRDNPVIASGRAKTAQSPGGTGALKIAADFIKHNLDSQKVWISDPSWANHQQIFSLAGLDVAKYRYYNAADKSLDFDGLITDLEKIPANDVVILHACCHNPSGVDPTQEQWQAIAEIAQKNQFLVLFDMAYQGFAKSVVDDNYAIRLFSDKLDELLIANSFSKNFGLYNERTGAFTLIGKNEEAATKAFSQVKRLIRANYSNPPAHGALIVSTVLNNEELSTLWVKELDQMRERIRSMRIKLQAALTDTITSEDFGFITQQNGMFSFSGLNKDQVSQLQKEKGVYIVASGRINVAGITDDNLPYLVDAIASVY